MSLKGNEVFPRNAKRPIEDGIYNIVAFKPGAYPRTYSLTRLIKVLSKLSENSFWEETARFVKEV